MHDGEFSAVFDAPVFIIAIQRPSEMLNRDRLMKDINFPFQSFDHFSLHFHFSDVSFALHFVAGNGF